MFKLFKRDPRQKLEKTIQRKLEEARDIQRSGDIKAYAELMKEIDELEKELEQKKD